jgi:hypothetical protein
VRKKFQMRRTDEGGRWWWDEENPCGEEEEERNEEEEEEAAVEGRVSKMRAGVLHLFSFQTPIFISCFLFYYVFPS